MKFFTACSTVEEIKKEYRRLAKQHHPDRGGCTETMKQVNNDYEAALAGIGKREAMSDGFREIIDALINLAGLEIEICGTWIWLSGNSYPHRDEIKGLGFKWASKKKRWYKSPEDEGKTKSRGLSMDKIRDLYGSEKIASKAAAKPLQLG